jgi:Protein of unknown function (DUF1592)/Protein of unknown function (DUF1588)/Protein of unknown function (DUF1595)/Protein of unknown function (DUF1585)/Protein of unknown function (DUF1587)
MRAPQFDRNQYVQALALVLASSLGACKGQLLGNDDTVAGAAATSASGNAGTSGSSNAGTGGSSDGAGNAGTGGVAVPPPPPPGVEGIGWSTRYPRLSHAQWENTVTDLLSLDAPPDLGKTFALDPDGRFDTFAARTVSANLWLDYQRAAEVVAAAVARDATQLGKAVSAQALGDARAFVTELGSRAFRRPLTEAEIESHEQLFERGNELLPGSDDFASGAELVIRALLQSPHFLYRVETSTASEGDKVWLNGYEVASRLSYGLWSTMPSAELLAAAQAGELVTPEGVERWTIAMQDDARAARALVGFHEQLFSVATYGTIEKNDAMFPTFTDALAPTLREEASRFFAEIVVSRGQSVAGLLTTPVTFVNRQTAPLYGLAASDYGSGLTKVELDPARRAGVLTQIGFLSKYGSQTQSDPILRGVHISLDIMCSPLPAPPNGAPPLPQQMEGQTNRERVQELTADPACAGCHETYINALGFALENYDAVGQWRDTDNEKPVNAAASHRLDGEVVSFDGAVELSQLLAQSPSVHRCYAKHWLEYVLGRRPSSEEDGALDELAAASLRTDSVTDLLKHLTALETFRARPQEAK